MKFSHQHFTQDITGFVTKGTDHPNLLPKELLAIEFEKLLPIITAIKNIMAGKENHTYLPAPMLPKLKALLSLPNKTDDLPAFTTIAQQIAEQKIDKVIILGTGGSSLGSQALYEMASQIEKTLHHPRLDILINFDPIDFQEKIKKINWQTTALIAISKSGDTLETILQTLFVLPLMEKSLGKGKVKNHFWVVSQTNDNPLNALAQYYGATTLPHDQNLSGRYSVLSVVGMLPAALAGLSVKKIRKGAKDILEQCLTTHFVDNPAAQSAIAIKLLEDTKAKNAVVMLSYADRLSTLCRWFRQLWAESLGKNRQGSSPIFATGPVDQHSQLELWLGGPHDKIFTILTTKEKIHLPTPDEKLLQRHKKLADYQGITLEDMMDACSSGITDVFHQYQLPVRSICLEKLDEESIGALLMHFMMETIFVAMLRDGFDPFDQPKVEDGKKLIRQKLKAIQENKKS